MIRFPFKGLFGKVAAAFRHKDRKPVEHYTSQPPTPKPVIPGGKEMMLRLVEEKRERRRARNRRLAGIA